MKNGDMTLESELLQILQKVRTNCKTRNQLNAVAQAQAEREACAAHAETQEHLRESVMAVLAMPIGRAGWDKPCNRAGLRLCRKLPKTGKLKLTSH